MKRAIAFIAAIVTVTGTFTACGKGGGEGDGKADASTASVSDEGAETTTDPFVFMQETMSYAAIMRAIVDASVEGDYEKTLSYIMPQRLQDCMGKLRVMEDYLMLDEEAGFTEIAVLQMIQASDNERQRMGKMLTVLANTFEGALDAGITYDMIMETEEIPASLQGKYNELMEYFGALDDIDNADIESEFDVDFMMNASFQMGETTLSVPVYKVKGDDTVRADILFYTLVAYQTLSRAEEANGQ